eukprot:6566401-Pyramimonas_sp.AAC.1
MAPDSLIHCLSCSRMSPLLRSLVGFPLPSCPLAFLGLIHPCREMFTPAVAAYFLYTEAKAASRLHRGAVLGDPEAVVLLPAVHFAMSR